MHTNIPQPYTGGITCWRLAVLNCVAKSLGLLVKVEGFPLGSRRCYRFDTEVSGHE